MSAKKERRLCRSCSKETKRPQDVYCDNGCQQEFQYEEYIRRWKLGQETGNKGENVSNHIRRYLKTKHGDACTRCNWSKVNPVTGRVPLNVEHLDGNSENTVPDNLDLICPCCHSLTPTYGALNKGNGRKKRKAVRNAGVVQR